VSARIAYTQRGLQNKLNENNQKKKRKARQLKKINPQHGRGSGQSLA